LIDGYLLNVQRAVLFQLYSEREQVQ